MKAEDEHRRSGDEKSGSGEVDATTKDIFTEDALDPVYQHKARVLNDAIQEIGMGRYQVGCYQFGSRPRDSGSL
ncbi:hypothetical protein PQX77_017439 [Marasmius sp. AFHP31]|nr:hypothetical protein PQX77_017439 [Marasmius sp. AFHP31]